MSVDALRPSYEAKRRRSLTLVQQALESLHEQGKAVTISTVEAETRKVDSDGIGVNRTTFKRNPEVAALVDQALSRPLHRAAVPQYHQVNTNALRPGRELNRAFHRLLSKSKQELATRVIVLEEELLDLRQQLANRDRLVIEEQERRWR